MKESSQIFPFFFLDKSNLLDLNGIDLPSQLKLLESYGFKSTYQYPHDFDMDENLIHKVNSDYYDIITFPKTMKTKDCFSLFHVNLRSLSAHIDEMQALLTALKSRLDVIGVSETKKKTGGFLKNVTLSGYVLHSQYSSSSAGGVALYVKEDLQHMMRDDISTCEDEFETIWIEIKNSKSQNVLCGCAYRHPNTNADKFNDYINQTMEKISKENKLIFLIGD